MDNEMLERVAKSIGDALYGYCDKKDTPNTWSLAMGAAIEAIKAMREPTEKMIKVGAYYSTAQSGVYDCDDVWKSMIDCITND